MASQGRPPKFNAEIAGKICQAVANGMSRNRAADLVGINRMTIQRWMKLGKSGQKSKKALVYASFVAEIVASEAKFIESNVKSVQKAATPRTTKVIKRTVRNTYDLSGNQTGTSEVIEETTKRELDWAAARWLLECKDRESFGPDRHEIAALKKDMAELQKLLSKTLEREGGKADQAETAPARSEGENPVDGVPPAVDSGGPEVGPGDQP